MAVISLAFLLGISAAKFRWFPAPAVGASLTQLQGLLATLDENDSDIGFLFAERYSETGTTVLKADQVQRGVTLITSVWKHEGRWQPQIRIIDMHGNVLHKWSAEFAEFWPESPYAETIIDQNELYVHGAWLLPDGDVVFNIDYMGLFRLDACGEIVWKLPYRTHHSIFRDEDGDFWVSNFNKRDEAIEQYFDLKPYFGEDSALKISPDGEILADISILDVIYSSEMFPLFASHRKTRDLTHQNDVEILSTELADDFSMFSAGDMLFSLRNISTVVVVDGKTRKIKWHIQYPLLEQHDPDFEPGGYITIYNNRNDGTREGRHLKQTEILRVHPASGRTEVIYPKADSPRFYSPHAGKHELLVNGNRLIVEPTGGRAFEINTDGEIVWNYIVDNKDNGLQAEIMQATRYPSDFADFSGISCGS